MEVISKTGEGTQKITKKEIVDAAIGRKEQELQDKRAKLIEGGSSEDDADLIVNRDRATYYAANRLDNTTWDMQFNNIAGMVGIDALAKGGAPAKQVTDIAELYLQVRAVSPAYAEGTVKNARAREFFEVYDVGRNVSRLPPEQAALSAASWVAKPETEKARDRIKNEEREEIVAQVLRGGWFSSLDDERANQILVRGRVEQLARMGHLAGVILQRTEDWLKSSTVDVNGVLVETKGRTPPDFKEVAEKYLSDLQSRNAREWGLEDEADGDLFLVPTPSGGRWFIWSKTMDTPLGTLGNEQLAEVHQKFQQEKTQKAVEL